jgi:predicted HAD superfamily phosphohydrolase YqeG
LPPEKVVMIGDQVFTDVLGANRCRIPSILVRYIGWDPDADPGKRRRAEAWILKHTAHKPVRHRLDGFIREEARADGQAAQAVL